MIYTVKAIAVMVEVGSRLWINAAQVDAVYPCLNSSDLPAVCVDVNGKTHYSNWTLEQVLEIIHRVSR